MAGDKKHGKRLDIVESVMDEMDEIKDGQQKMQNQLDNMMELLNKLVKNSTVEQAEPETNNDQTSAEQGNSKTNLSQCEDILDIELCDIDELLVENYESNTESFDKFAEYDAILYDIHQPFDEMSDKDEYKLFEEKPHYNHKVMANSGNEYETLDVVICDIHALFDEYVGCDEIENESSEIHKLFDKCEDESVGDNVHNVLLENLVTWTTAISLTNELGASYVRDQGHRKSKVVWVLSDKRIMLRLIKSKGSRQVEKQLKPIKEELTCCVFDRGKGQSNQFSEMDAETTNGEHRPITCKLWPPSQNMRKVFVDRIEQDGDGSAVVQLYARDGSELILAVLKGESKLKENEESEIESDITKTVLDISKGQRAFIEQEEAETLLSPLQAHGNSFTKICFSNRSFGLGSAHVAAPFVASIKNQLKKVDLSDFVVGRPKAEVLDVMNIFSEALERYQNISDNALVEKGVRVFGRLLQSQYSLEELYLMNDGISKEAARVVRNLVPSTDTLKVLHFHNNMTGDNGAMAISEILNGCPLLEDFRCSSTRVGGIALTEALAECRNLKKNDLLDNMFGVDLGVKLSKALYNQEFLTEIYLSYMNLEDEGEIAIANALKEATPSLEVLEMSGNDITAEAAPSLAACLSEQKALAKLNMSENEFGKYIFCVFDRGKFDVGDNMNTRAQMQPHGIQKESGVYNNEIIGVSQYSHIFGGPTAYTRHLEGFNKVCIIIYLSFEEKCKNCLKWSFLSQVSLLRIKRISSSKVRIWTRNYAQLQGKARMLELYGIFIFGTKSLKIINISSLRTSFERRRE